MKTIKHGGYEIQINLYKKIPKRFGTHTLAYFTTRDLYELDIYNGTEKHIPEYLGILGLPHKSLGRSDEIGSGVIAHELLHCIFGYIKRDGLMKEIIDGRKGEGRGFVSDKEEEVCHLFHGFVSKVIGYLVKQGYRDNTDDIVAGK